MDDQLLDRLLRHPYFGQRPPASTGREAFSADFLDAALSTTSAVEPQDLLATLTELTAVSVGRALGPYDVVEVVASGGGVRNPALMGALRRVLGETPLLTSDELGIPAETKEVALSALLGFLTWHGVPGSISATGAVARRVLGRINPGDSPLIMPPPVRRPPRCLRTPLPTPAEPR